MSKTVSGLILIGTAMLTNVVGKLLLGATRDTHNVGIAGALALLMLVSLVMGLFGLFRLVSGLLSKK